ncbi:MAG: hypothetical protein IJV45_09475 [Prevotella sp.]|nr:hypothetical protein [Prevotella sp.]
MGTSATVPCAVPAAVLGASPPSVAAVLVASPLLAAVFGVSPPSPVSSCHRHHARVQPVLNPRMTIPKCLPSAIVPLTLTSRWIWSGMIATRHTSTIG